MAVRAKFRLNSYTTEMHNSYPDYAKTKYQNPVPVEKRTLNFTPVGVNQDEDGSENALFWEASPSGSLQLGVVNQEAWEQFELGKSYYLDFIPALD